MDTSQLVPERINDPLAAACQELLARLLSRIPTAGVISLGIPKVLYPHVELVRNWPIQIYENDWENNYNFEVQGPSQYVLAAWEELRAAGFSLPNTPQHPKNWYALQGNLVVLDRVQNWRWHWFSERNGLQVDKVSDYLFLLDTCRLDTLLGMGRSSQGPLPKNSVVMLNTCDTRRPNYRFKYAQDLFARPVLLGEAWYSPRWQGAPRLISFFAEESESERFGT